jgi:hypothetical protein
MITIFGDFRQFSAEKIGVFLKNQSFLAQFIFILNKKTPIFSAKIFLKTKHCTLQSISQSSISEEKFPDIFDKFLPKSNIYEFVLVLKFMDIRYFNHNKNVNLILKLFHMINSWQETVRPESGSQTKALIRTEYRYSNY